MTHADPRARGPPTDNHTQNEDRAQNGCAVLAYEDRLPRSKRYADKWSHPQYSIRMEIVCLLCKRANRPQR